MKGSINSIIKLLCISMFLCLTVTGLDVNAQAQEDYSSNRDSVIAAAREIIGHVTYCALITIDSSGTADIRTMNPFPPEEDMNVWMATKKGTRKYEEIKKNPKVTLYYANHAAAEGYTSIKGKAYLIDDKDEIMKRKRAYWDQAFPDFSQLVLIKIVPEKLEVINYKRKVYNSAPDWHPPFVEFEKM